MASKERKERLREDIIRLLRELNFAMEDAWAHDIPWEFETANGGLSVFLNTSKDSEVLRALASEVKE